MKTCLARLVFREQCLGTVLAVHPNHFIVKMCLIISVPNGFEVILIDYSVFTVIGTV